MWWEGLLGGVGVGMSSALLLLITGRLTGISGFINTLALFNSSDMRFKLSWLSGLLVVAAAAAIPDWSREYLFTLKKGPDAPFLEGSELAYALGGFLVGFGTRFGSGCTSGHGVCGMSRMSPRSIVATAAFMATGFLTATAINSPGNGGGKIAGMFDAQGNPMTMSGNVMLKENADLFLSNDPIPEVAMAVLAVGAVVLAFVLAMWRSSHDLIDSIVSWISGGIFGVGLAIGGMTQREKLVGFLTLDYRWDSQLAFVMGFGVLVVAAGYRLAYELGEPLMAAHPEGADKKFDVPLSRTITVRLVLGGMVFGVGWAMTGACPGPALMMAAAGKPMILILYLPAMVLGMWANHGMQDIVQLAENGVHAILDEIALLAGGHIAKAKSKARLGKKSSDESEASVEDDKGDKKVVVVGGGASDQNARKMLQSMDDDVNAHESMSVSSSADSVDGDLSGGEDGDNIRRGASQVKFVMKGEDSPSKVVVEAWTSSEAKGSAKQANTQRVQVHAAVDG